MRREEDDSDTSDEETVVTSKTERPALQEVEDMRVSPPRNTPYLHSWAEMMDRLDEEYNPEDRIVLQPDGAPEIREVSPEVEDVLLGRPVLDIGDEDKRTEDQDMDPLEQEQCQDPRMGQLADEELLSYANLPTNFIGSMFWGDIDELFEEDDPTMFERVSDDDTFTFVTVKQEPKGVPVPSELMIGQSDMDQIVHLAKIATTETALEQTENLDRKWANIRKILPKRGSSLLGAPDNLGTLSQAVEIDPMTIWSHFTNEGSCKNLKGRISITDDPMSLEDYPDTYLQGNPLTIHMLNRGWRAVVFTPEGTQKCYSIGMSGPSCMKNFELSVCVNENTNVLYSTLYDYGGVATTGMGFSTALHFYAAIILIQNARDFTVEEERVDLKIEGQEVEIGTKSERSRNERTIYIDKYRLCQLCGDARMSKHLAASYFSDKNMVESLTLVRRNYESGNESRHQRDFDDSVWKFAKASNRLKESHYKALSCLEYEAQQECMRRQVLEVPNFERDKEICLQAIEDCLDWCYTPSEGRLAWGCASPCRILRMGDRDISHNILKSGWVQKVLDSKDMYDENRKSNYWIKKEDLEAVEKHIVRPEPNKRYWGYDDLHDVKDDKLDAIHKTLKCSKLYASSQCLAAVAACLSRRTKNTKMKTWEFILNKTVICVWHSKHSIKANCESFKVQLIRGVNFHTPQNEQRDDLLEGKWIRCVVDGETVEVSPMFSITSKELNELNSMPRRMLNLYTAFYEKFQKNDLKDVITLANTFFLATVGGNWRSTTLCGSHRYLTERIMSGYIDPSLLTDSICKPTHKLKSYCEYYYLILIKRCIQDWRQRYEYVAKSPLFRFPTTLLGLEMNMHYMMGSTFSSGTDHRETCMEKTLKEMIEFKNRKSIIAEWIDKQTEFIISLGSPEAIEHRFDKYFKLREAPAGTDGKNCVCFLSYTASCAIIKEDVRRMSPGSASGYASLSTMVTNKAILKVMECVRGPGTESYYTKTKSCIEMKDIESSGWCKTVPYNCLEEIRNGSQLVYYYFPKEGAQKGDREISTMSKSMRFPQIMGESCVTSLCSTMYGDTMVDKQKRNNFYNQTRTKPGYTQPASSSEDRERFGPNFLPVQMGAHMSILARILGDSSLATSGMCVTLFTDKIGVMPVGTDPYEPHTERLASLMASFTKQAEFTGRNKWNVNGEVENAYSFHCKVSMGQGLYGRTAGVAHNVVITAHEKILHATFGALCEHLVSSDDVYRNISLPLSMKGISPMSVLLFSTDAYQSALVGSGTIDSKKKSVKAVHIGEYNNETVFSDPRSNPDPSVVEAICAISGLPHNDILSDVEHCRSSAKNVFLNGGSLTMVRSTMRCYSKMMVQKWVSGEDFDRHIRSYNDNTWRRLMSENPEDVISPLPSVLGLQRMRAIYQRIVDKGEVKNATDILSKLHKIGFRSSTKSKKLPDLGTSFWSNPLTNFEISLAGCSRGLQNERGNPGIFSINKSARYRVSLPEAPLETLTALSAIERFTTPDREGVDLPDEIIKEIEEDRYIILTHVMSKRRPFREFVMAGEISEKTSVTKTNIVWMDLLPNYNPAGLSEISVSELKNSTREQKLQFIMQKDRKKRMRLKVKHSCGEPRQGPAYSKTSQLGFHAELCKSGEREIAPSTISPMIWGGESLYQLMMDWRSLGMRRGERPILAQLLDGERRVYSCRGMRGIPLEGLEHEAVDESIGLLRYRDDRQNVIYALEWEDWSDIVPSDFDVSLPDQVVSPSIGATPIQHFNRDGYSRTRNRATMKISSHIGIRLEDWCFEPGKLVDKNQVVVKVPKDFVYIHYDRRIQNTSRYVISPTLDEGDTIVHIRHGATFGAIMECDLCESVREGLVRNRKRRAETQGSENKRRR